MCGSNLNSLSTTNSKSVFYDSLLAARGDGPRQRGSELRTASSTRSISIWIFQKRKTGLNIMRRSLHFVSRWVAPEFLKWTRMFCTHLCACTSSTSTRTSTLRSRTRTCRALPTKKVAISSAWTTMNKRTSIRKYPNTPTSTSSSPSVRACSTCA